MHNRALLLQQPRRNSYGIRVHLTCPGVFARVTAHSSRRKYTQQYVLRVGPSEEDSTRTVDDGGRWYNQGWSWLLGVVHRGRRTPGRDGTSVCGSRDAGNRVQHAVIQHMGSREPKPRVAD